MSSEILRQAQGHGPGGQPSGGRGEREDIGTVFMLFFPEGGIGAAPMAASIAATQNA